MKISSYLPCDSVKFENITLGNLFNYEGHFYLKIKFPSDATMHGVNVETGMEKMFSSDAIVCPVSSATVVLCFGK